MVNTHDRLEALFEKVRALPDPEQEAVVEALTELTSGSPYQLTDDELSVLVPELEGAHRGEFATKEAVDAVLGAPWKKSRSS